MAQKITGDRLIEAFPYRELAEAWLRVYAEALTQAPELAGYGVYVAHAGNGAGWGVYLGPLNKPRQVGSHATGMGARPHRRH